MNTHDIELPPMPEMEVLGHDAWQKPIYGYGIYTMRYLLRREIEADRKRMATVVESAWREGWGACRDSEYIGSEAEDSAYGDSEANRIALDLDQGEPCGLEADRRRRGEPVAWAYKLTPTDGWTITKDRPSGYQVMPLYAAPQPAEPVKVPNIPPERPNPWFEEGASDVFAHAQRQAYVDGWNDCREAFLKETNDKS